jgi:hypothetical protein
MTGKMRKIVSLSLIIPILALGIFTTPVHADRVFHTERLSFVLTSDGAAAGYPALRAGLVVDIHTNGPVIYALERYMLNGAKPNTDYQVVLNVSATGCGNPQNVKVSTALLTADAQGDAAGDHTFTPADVAAAGLHAGMTLGITWTFVSNGIIAYQTPSCINVGLD